MPRTPGRPKKPDFLQPIPCPDCGQTFTPVNVNQKRCVACIAAANKKVAEEQRLARIKAEIEAMHKKHPPANHNPVGMATCAVCGKEFEAKNLRNAKYCSDECKKSVKTKAHRDKKETVSDNQKLVWVRCKNPECPNGGKFQTTWEKYRKGAAYCNKECNYRAKYLQSKKYQRDQEEKRAQAPAQVVEIDYTPHPAQQLFHASSARVKVLVCGARFGKDRACIQEFIKKFAEMLSEVRPSTNVPRVLGWLVAPSFPLARQLWREIKEYFPREWIIGKPNEAEQRIDTIGGGLIEVKSANDPDSLVAVGADIVLLSEFSRVSKKEEVWSYVWGRVSSPHRGPGGKGGLVLINSTPKGMDLFYDMYRWGQDPDMPEWESWQFPSSANPYFDPANLEMAKKTMPHRLYLQEHEAVFLSDGGDVFLNVDEVSIGTIQEPQPGEVYIGSWDPAEKGDFSCFTIINSKGQQVFLKRWTGVPYSIQLNEVEYCCKKYNYAPVNIDITAAGSTTLVQALTLKGITAVEVVFNNAAKAQWVSRLAILLENKEIVLLDPKISDDAKAQNQELRAYTYTYTSTGKISYHHVEGQHDDAVDALLMAYKDYQSPTETLPYVGLLLGGRRKSA